MIPVRIFSQSLTQAKTETKMSDISPTFHKLTGFGDGYVVVEGPVAVDASFVETENGFVIGLPGGMTVSILHEKFARAQEGAVSKNESNREDDGLDDDAKSDDEQRVDPKLMGCDHGAEVKIERLLINQTNSFSDEEEEAGAEQVETERGVIDSTYSPDSDSDSEQETQTQRRY
jgi:hypothetical protein